MSDLKEVTGKIIDKETKAISRKCTSYVNFGETAEESIEMFGSEAVNTNAWANYKITARAAVVRMMNAGKTDEQIQDVMESAKMGVAVSGGAVDPIQASLAKFKTMSPEEQAEYLNQLRAAASDE